MSPAVSNRMPECFPEPERFDPSRYVPPREEDKQGFAWIPFGGGRHRCVGASFAMMQLKAIFSVLLRRFEFEMAQPSESYRNDHSKMVVQLEQPCRVRYRRRAAHGGAGRAGSARERAAGSGALRVRVDADLCQGHGVCAGEAPEVFRVDPKTGPGRAAAWNGRPRRCARASRRPCATARRARSRSPRTDTTGGERRREGRPTCLPSRDTSSRR